MLAIFSHPPIQVPKNGTYPLGTLPGQRQGHVKLTQSVIVLLQRGPEA